MLTYRFTINTDASYYSDYKVAAYAYWIKSEHYKQTSARLIRGETEDSHIAELLGIEAAILWVQMKIDDTPLLLYYMEQGHIELTINTDSKWSIRTLTGVHASKKHQEVIDRVIELLEPYDVKFQHVKAHTRNPAARSWVNRWCDREAKKIARERVMKLRAR